jgi:hypothetical protein
MTNPTSSASEPARSWPEPVTVAVGLSVVGLFLFWDARNAGSAETDWLPGAVLLAGLVLSVLVGAGGLPRRLGRAALVAVASLSGLTAWALASIAWAEVQGDAWNGANRAFLYLAAFTLLVVLPWRASSATVFLGAYVMGTAAVAALAVRHAASGPDRFLDGRLSSPTGYPNANAALFLSAFWVALVLSTRRTVPIPLRVAAAAAAALLPQAAMLSQSRGSAVAFAASAVAVLILVPGRVRTAAGIAVATTIVALSWDTHLAVFDAAFSNVTALEHAVSRSGLVMAGTSAGTAAATLVWALADARVELSSRVSRLLARAGAAAAALAVVGVVVGVAASQPVDRAEQAWANFTAVDATDSSKSHFSLGVGSNRHDFWRVAISRFEDRPITGVGADNFAVDYMKERRSMEEPSYPHSLWVMILSQLGVVGAAVFATFLVAVGIATVPRPRQDPATIAVGGAALAGALYFFVHASVDWFWEIPALGGPALALLGLAAAVRGSGGDEARGVAGLPRPALAAIVAAAGVGIASCAAPWLSERQVDKAIAVWRADPAEAYDLLAAARSLNPLSAKPDLLGGAIAAKLDDRSQMTTLFARSVERNPHSWYAQLELGLAESLLGRRPEALTAIRRSVSLNPREPLLRDVLVRVRRGERIAPSSLDVFFADRIAARTR